MSNIKLWELCMDEDDSDYAYPYYKGYIAKNKYFKCSLIDREIVEQYTWKIDHNGYLATKINNKNVYMHNLLIGEILVDHINKIRTDNRRCNLRKCTSQENNRNRKVWRVCTTKRFIKRIWNARRIKNELKKL